jgi:hypothetical protein
MKLSSFALVTLVTLTIYTTATLAATSWTVHNTPYSILASLSFPTNSIGFAAGGQNGEHGGPQMYKVTAAVNNTFQFQLMPNDGDDMMFMAVTASTETTGVASGLGLLEPANSYTDDGQKWQKPKESLGVTTCQSGERVQGTTTGFGMTGGFGSITGVAMTMDGGKSFTAHHWGGKTEARYGAFPSATTWYIAGGTWPENNRNTVDHQFTRYFHIDAMENQVKQMPYYPSVGNSTNEFIATVQKTTDGGKTFTNVFNNTGEYYFNQISCPTTQHCWAVSEGDKGAWIWVTKDGGSNWEMQHFQQGASLMAVEMLDANTGFAGGLQLTTGGGLIFSTTDGGTTWTPTTVGSAYVNDFSFVGNKGYATGFTNFGYCVLLTTN